MTIAECIATFNITPRMTASEVGCDVRRAPNASVGFSVVSVGATDRRRLNFAVVWRRRASAVVRRVSTIIYTLAHGGAHVNLVPVTKQQSYKELSTVVRSIYDM